MKKIIYLRIKQWKMLILILWICSSIAEQPVVYSYTTVHIVGVNSHQVLVDVRVKYILPSPLK